MATVADSYQVMSEAVSAFVEAQEAMEAASVAFVQEFVRNGYPGAAWLVIEPSDQGWGWWGKDVVGSDGKVIADVNDEDDLTYALSNLSPQSDYVEVRSHDSVICIKEHG